MVEILIVDGYNVIHSIPELENELNKSLMSARTALSAILRSFQEKSRSIKEIYVVYDAKTSKESNIEDAGLIKSIYTSKSDDADQKIVSMIKNFRNPQKIAVLSRDNFVINHARIMGANILSLESFLRKTAKGRTYREKLPLSESEKDDVTRELKKIWKIE